MANQAWQITAPGQLTLRDLGSSIPTPGPRQALVHMQAVALNWRDTLVVDHNPAYPMPAKQDLIPCSDGAGVIEEAGPDSKWKKGDKVFLQVNTWMHGNDPRDMNPTTTLGGGNCDGTLRRWMVCDDERLVAGPDGYSMEQMSMFYSAGVTAWHALFHCAAKLKPGMTVLTQGTGGVSCFAIMIAAAYGATVVATSSSDEKLQAAKAIGATHLVNYRKHPEWSAEVLKATGGKGVDMAVDVVGAQTIEETIKSTRFGGHISLVGLLSDDPNRPVQIMTPLLFGAKTLQAFVGAGSRDLAEEFAAFARDHELPVPIAQTFDFEQADKALAAITKLPALGKVVIKIA